MIYFITDGTFIKIGFARCAKNRLGKLQTGNPHRLFLLASCEGDRALEQSLHRISKHRTTGSQEWYLPRLPLLALIGRVQTRGGSAITRRLAAHSRLRSFCDARTIQFGEQFERNASGLIDQLCHKHGVEMISEITGQSPSAVRLQRRGTCQVGALALARLGTIEPDAINSLICRAEKFAA